MDRGAWQTIAHGGRRESDTTFTYTTDELKHSSLWGPTVTTQKKWSLLKSSFFEL